MSGFFCVFGRDGAPSLQEPLQRAASRLAGFARDSTRTWHESRGSTAVGLGCLSTRITAEDGLQPQPAISANGNLVIVADARLDNREELAGKLGIERGRLPKRSDSTLIMDAYQRWREDCVGHLLGDFAFVIWDRQSASLFCARDHIGYRPFFYHLSPTLFVAASAPRGVLALAGIPRRLSEKKLSAFMVGLHEPPDSMYEGVSRLPPAHWLRVDASRTSCIRYWQLDPSRRLRLSSDEEYLEAFRELLSRAVRARLRTTGEIGVLVSGGLDSSSVASVAAAQLEGEGRRLKGYTSIPPRGFNGLVRRGCYADESPLVAALAAATPNLDAKLVPAEWKPAFANLSPLFDLAEIPLLNLPNLGWHEQILSLAQGDGVRVLLSGEMGNGTISYGGDGLYYRLLMRGRWLTLRRELAATVRVRGRGWWPVVKQSLLRPATPDWLWRAYWRVVRGHGCQMPIEFPINPEFARQWRVRERYGRAYGCHPLLAANVDPRFRAMLISGLNIGDGLDVLHALSARYGIEVRDPTADVRVAEFCMAVPEEQYARQGSTRCLVRRAMRGRLPAAILDNTGMGLQGMGWLDRLRADREWIVTQVGCMEQSDAARRYLDLRRLHRLADDWPPEGGQNLEARDAHAHVLAWGVMMGLFLRWFEEEA